MKNIISIAFGMIASMAVAQPTPTESVVRDDFVVQGDTIFVRHYKRPYSWTNPLSTRLNNFYAPSKIKTVVFVNMSEVGRWEKVGSEVLVQQWLKAANATTIAVGACENYCASWFAGGAKRLLARGAYLELKTPIDFDTKKLDPRFPHTQFAVYERDKATPGVLPYKDIFFEAFTKGGMTGGTRFSHDQVQFCASRNPDDDCKIYEGLNAYKVGLITEPIAVDVKLPDGW